MVPSLEEYCLVHLVLSIELYPPGVLALLPQHLRRALLSLLPPVYLYSLEGTPVMSGLDSNLFWEHFLEDKSIHQDWVRYKASAFAFEKGWVTTLRDKFALFVLTRTLEQEKTFKIQLPLEVYLFGVTKSRLSHEIVAVFQQNPSCLIGKGIVVPQFSPKSVKQLINILVHFEVHSTAVALKLMKIPADYLSQLCSPEFSVILANLFTVSTVRYLSLSFGHSLYEHSYTPFINCIFSGIAQNCHLKELKLKDIGHDALFAVGSYLSTQYGGLSKLDIAVKSSQVNVTQSLVSIISNQGNLNELKLCLKRVYMGESRDLFSKGLASVFERPQVQFVSVTGPCDVDVCQLLSSFLHSSVLSVCTLTLSDIDVHTYNAGEAEYPLPTKEHMVKYGDLRILNFLRLSFKSSLLAWLFSMESIRLCKLRFEDCRVIDVPRIKILDYFEQHSDFHVQKYKEV